MGEFKPEVGERVLFYLTADETCMAVVVRVEFWDLVDIEISGALIRDVRRVVVLDDEPGARVGRFERLPGAK